MATWNNQTKNSSSYSNQSKNSSNYSNNSKNNSSYENLEFGYVDCFLLESGDKLLSENGNCLDLESSIVSYSNQSKNSSSWTNQTKN